MKVMLRRNVPNLGIIGDVVDVKDGYARNYLLPQGLGLVPTKANIRSVELEKERYLQQLAREKAEVQARAQLVNGKEITLSARANEEGHLYGSVGPAQIVAALAEQGLFIEAENVVLDEPIRQLDKYDLELRFAQEVKATIHVWIVRLREGEEGAEAPEQPGAPDEAAGDESVEAVE